MNLNDRWTSCFRSAYQFVTHEQGYGSVRSRRYNGASEFPKTFNIKTKADQKKKLPLNTGGSPTVNL